MSKLLLVSVVCLGLVGCKKPATIEVDKRFEVQDQQTVVIVLPAGTPQFRVAKIADSRCPTGAQRIWAGQVAVDVELSAGPDSARVTGLYLGQGITTTWHNRDSAAVVLAGQSYWLYLLAVNPYPAVNGSGKKTATFRLTIR